MSDWANEKLRKWGEWSAKRESGVIGYPKASPTFRVEASSGCGKNDMVDPDIMTVDRIVSGLQHDEPRLFVVAVCWYVFCHDSLTIANRLRCARSTFYVLLDALKARVHAGFGGACGKISNSCSKNACKKSDKRLVFSLRL